MFSHCHYVASGSLLVYLAVSQTVEGQAIPSWYISFIPWWKLYKYMQYCNTLKIIKICSF